MLMPLSPKPRSAEKDFVFPWGAVEEAVAQFGTPLYVYFPELARSAFARFQAGADAWGLVHVAYSLKTNPLPSLLKDLRECGAWIEVVSQWEAHIAARAGFSTNNTIFNGPLKPA